MSVEPPSGAIRFSCILGQVFGGFSAEALGGIQAGLIDSYIAGFNFAAR